MIFLPLAHGASSSTSGTRVVLPAPGGATRTALVRPSSVAVSSSSAASIGSGVSKERGKSLFRRHPRERAMQSLLAALTGSAGYPGCAGYDNTASGPRRPSDALVDKTICGHVLGAIDVAQVDHDRMRQFALQAFQIECAILRPLGHHHHRVRAACANI